MNDVVKFLVVESTFLAVGLIIITLFLIYNFRKQRSTKRPRTESLEGKCIILPSNDSQLAEFEKRVEQLFSADTDHVRTTDDHSSVIDEINNIAKRGRLYFSITYEETRGILTIKLIKGENLPTLSQESSKAYVNVQLICRNGDRNSNQLVKQSGPNYQRTHQFYIPPTEFLSYILYFEISRFDRYSRKYDVAHVIVSLLELQAEIVGLHREKIFAKDIICNWNNMSRKRRRSWEGTRDNSEMCRMRRDIKVRYGRPRLLWKKLSLAVHSGLFKDATWSNNDSLQWDPFIVVQRYKFCDDHTTEFNFSKEDPFTYTTGSHGLPRPSHMGAPPLFTDQQYEDSSTTENYLHDSASETENGNLLQPPTTLQPQFYQLVHSPHLERRLKPITSWSIPESFPFPVSSSQQNQKRTCVFQDVPIPCERQDRLHKLTSLSSNYREKILRKSRRRTRSCKGRLSGRLSLHESLYLGKDTQQNTTENSNHKRIRRLTHS